MVKKECSDGYSCSAEYLSEVYLSIEWLIARLSANKILLLHFDRCKSLSVLADAIFDKSNNPVS